MENNYYVYEWIRLDTNEPFYVGKGKDDRWKCIYKRNKHFNNIINKHHVVVNILHDGLDEQVAYDLECYYIWMYRDIIGYDLCNINDGGEGQSLCGKNNPFYGRYHSEETKRKISEANKGKTSHNQGKSPSEETKRKMSENHADFKGKKHPRAISVICLTTKKIFYTAKEGASYYNCDNSKILKCCKGYEVRRGSKKPVLHAGRLPNGTKLIWRYLIWQHNKKYRIKGGR